MRRGRTLTLLAACFGLLVSTGALNVSAAVRSGRRIGAGPGHQPAKVIKTTESE
jgi:hypothetical protein